MSLVARRGPSASACAPPGCDGKRSSVWTSSPVRSRFSLRFQQQLELCQSAVWRARSPDTFHNIMACSPTSFDLHLTADPRLGALWTRRNQLVLVLNSFHHDQRGGGFTSPRWTSDFLEQSPLPFQSQPPTCLRHPDPARSNRPRMASQPKHRRPRSGKQVQGSRPPARHAKKGRPSALAAHRLANCANHWAPNV